MGKQGNVLKKQDLLDGGQDGFPTHEECGK
jgi:hypothetical protein